MIRKFAAAITLVGSVFSVQATEVLDVLVIYDTKTISNTQLNTISAQYDYATSFVSKLNFTFSNSGLGNDLQFNLRKYLSADISYEMGYYQNIDQKAARYEGYSSEMTTTGNPKGKAHIIQNMFDADVVAVITYEANIDSCGKAVHIPTRSELYSEQSVKDSVEFGGLGLLFVNATDDCIIAPEVPAHEFGHTAGLYHGQYTDKGLNYEKDIEPNMLKEGASGYNYMPWWALNFRTIMARKPSNDKYYNRFSDVTRHDCNGQITCGSEKANAVVTLKAYAEQYNKRGNWFDTH